jgi:branched-chain amino acid transport system permease protein
MRPNLVRIAVAALAALALATFPRWSGGWESSRYATTVLADVLVYGMFAMSLNLLVGSAGMPSLGHAAFFGAGAYAAGIAGQRLGADNLFVPLVAALVVSAALSLVIGTLSVRASGIFFLMLTLAFAQMVFAYAFKATDLTGGSNGLASVPRPELLVLDFNALDDLYALIAVAFVLVLLLTWVLSRSVYGRALVGIRENERRMRALGYDTTRLKLSVFVLAGTLAGFAGAFAAWYHRYVAVSDTGIGTSISGLIMVLVGGAGSVFGPALGAAVVYLIERVLDSYVPFAQTVLGIVFVVFVLAARQGIVGLARTGYARVRR